MITGWEKLEQRPKTLRGRVADAIDHAKLVFPNSPALVQLLRVDLQRRRFITEPEDPDIDTVLAEIMALPVPEEVTDETCRIVAAHQIALIVDEHLSWENCPEIGEYDWMAVQEAAKGIAREHCVSAKEYQAAYALLESRANQDGES